ncbi:hypothetical protein OHB39_38885 [Streptomyces sp. NBC_00047]|uniref:hypothetical protein n=1 Tax=Streptomyces sp. NBC_00047 TaxID=2975627 RepID=UPI002252696B|nr:hypothetical protein [Streptomyces sp. NBC_00047]MCX5613429.1 hypothetical protein [Streptomyces sp. NBC_00047]
MKPPMPDSDAVRTAMDAVLAEAAAAGRRATVTAVERRLGVTHATFYRHHHDLITSYFQPRATPAFQPETLSTGEQARNNLRRLRQENADLRRTLHLYEEAIRQLAIENDALRQQATVIPLPARADQRPRL